MASSLFFSVGSIGLSKRGKRSPSTILMAARHNRRAEQNERGSRANINPELSHLNQRLRGPSTAEEVAALAHTLMAAAGVAVDKLRKDYTQAVELLFSLPPDTTINTQEYFERCVAWVEMNFGAENILSADVHRDEAAPHCHVLVLPLVDGQMRGANLLALSHVARLRDDFYKEVAKHYGMRKAARLDGVSRGALAVAVLDRLKASGDPVMRSPVWNEVRAAVERDPAPFAQALGVSPGAGAAMVNAAASVDAGGQPQAETMQAPEDGEWWQGMPMAADGLADGAESVLHQGDIQAPGMMPQAMPSLDPLDTLPPVEIKSQMQRLSEAGSVDEAIAALQEPSPVDVARAETAQMLTERQRLEAARERAKADRLAAEQEMAQARAMRIQAERERLRAMRARALGY